MGTDWKGIPSPVRRDGEKEEEGTGLDPEDAGHGREGDLQDHEEHGPVDVGDAVLVVGRVEVEEAQERSQQLQRPSLWTMKAMVGKGTIF